MIFAELNKLPGELQKLILLFITRPIEPADLVVLTISVVVAVLRPAPLIAAGQHWHALRKKKCRQEIPPLPFAQGIDLWVIGRPFDAAIPRLIIIVPVVVAVAVRLIVLFIVADQVVESKTIVRGNEIHARVRAPPILLVQVRTAGKPVAHLADAALVAFPKTADCVAVFAVPFRKRRGEISHLITTVAHVPWLRDQFHLRQD